MNWVVHAELGREEAFDVQLPAVGDERPARAPELAVPVEQLLVSVASCFAESCQASCFPPRGEARADVSGRGAWARRPLIRPTG